MSHSHDHGHDHSDSAYHHGHHHGGHDPWHEEHDHSHGDHSEDDEAERRHFLKVVDAFNHYQVNTLAMNAKRKRDWEQTIPEAHRALVPSFGAKLDAIDGLARENYQFIRQIIEEESPFPYEEAKTMHLEGSADVESDPVTEQDHDKVRSSLRQFVRDWSSEGAVERDRTYKPLVEALESHFSDLDIDERGAIYVLVPGAGLGRLAYDVARRGFSCQGNEFSYYMLLASNFILNKCSRPNQHTIFPWIHSLSNSVSAGDNIRGVTVPDVLPSDLMDTVDFSMAAGDFLEIYNSPSQTAQWHCVMTCFFLDTAKNIIQYVETIKHCLPDGGLWINLGPLLYHFEGMQNESSIELSYEELKIVMQSMGFDILEERDAESTYAGNPKSMLSYNYRCKMFVARKIPAQ